MVDDEKKLQNPAEVKRIGNKAFVVKNYKEAIKQYSIALSLSPNPQLKSELHANRSNAYLRQFNFKSALEDCNEALEILKRKSKLRMKVLFRRGQANEGLNNIEAAMADFRAALAIGDTKQARKEVKQKLDMLLLRGGFTRKDQEQISRFSSLNKELAEVKDELNILAQKKTDVMSAKDELEDTLEDEGHMMAIGDFYVPTEKDDLDNWIDQELETLNAKEKTLQSRRAFISLEMESLKKSLYTKFQDQINLD